MLKTPNDTGSSVSARIPITCVLLPVTLALIAIFSTTLSADIQSQMMMGLPVILWFWFSISLLICASSFFFAVQVINAKENNQRENSGVNKVESDDE